MESTMKKTYKVKVISSAGEAQVLDVTSSMGVGSTTINAVVNGRYQLIDTVTGSAPDNIRTRRQGKDLQVYFDGREQADLVIADYFADSTPSPLMGEAQSGVLHAYIPESGQWASSLPHMADGTAPIGMALASEPLALADFVPASLAVAAGINPLWGAPLLLLGAGGGGKNASPSGSPPIVKLALLFAADDTGLSASDGLTNIKTPRIAGETEANAKVKITINGNAYTGSADAQGHFLVPINDPLPDGPQNYKVEVTNAAGQSTTVNGTPFTVDTAAPTHVSAALSTLDDTGLSKTDGITGDNTPRIAGATEANASVKITINGHDYLGQADEKGNFLIQVTDVLPDGLQSYTVQATDAAGNFKSVSGTTFTVDTQPQQGPGTQNDPNAGFNVQILRLTPDTGVNTVVNQTDFLTNAKNLTFTGKLTNSLSAASFNPLTGSILAEVLDSSGHIVAMQYLTPVSGEWTFDNKATALGEDGKVTTYTLKTATVDNAGHLMNASTHAFTVDLQAPVIDKSNVHGSPNLFTGLDFSANEQGVWLFGGTQINRSAFNLGITPTRYEPNKFPLVFRDAAGNETTFHNSNAWDLDALAEIKLSMSSDTPPGFDSDQLVGSVGKYTMEPAQALDASSLYTLTPTVQAIGGINHFVMAEGPQTLNLSIGDVLQLGISNSFSNDTAFKDHLQMRVDGDSADNLSLTKQWGNSNAQNWSLAKDPVNLDRQSYNVYFNETLKLDLFVQSAVHVTLA